MTKEKLHPFVKAKTIPDKDMEKAINMEPIFSPKALFMAKHSLLSLEESS